MSKHTILLASAAAVCTLLVSGCGGGVGAKPVSGKVTYADGTPVSGARVVFDSPQAKSNAEGLTNSEGIYELTTQDPGDGAIPGEYRVIVMHQSLSGESKVDKKYSNYDTSELAYTVGPEGGQYNIQVERAGEAVASTKKAPATNTSRTLAGARKSAGPEAAAQGPELPTVKDPSVLAKLPFLGKKSS